MIRKYLVTATALSVILGGLITAVVLVSQNQDIRNKAATSTGIGEVILSPETLDVNKGQIFPVDIKFRTGPTNADAVVISSIALRMVYSYSGDVPALEVVDEQGNAVAAINPNSELFGDWFFPVNSVSYGDANATIDLAAANVSFAGYSSDQFVDLGRIYFKANTSGIYNLVFDQEKSVMMTKNSNAPVDVLLSPRSGVYNILEEASTPVPQPAGYSVSIDHPPDNSTVKRNSRVVIQASTSVNDVDKVDFLVNNNLKCTDYEAPYTCDYRFVGKPRASYLIQVNAYRGTSMETDSATVTAK